MSYHRPSYKRTSRKPVTVEGVTFESWTTGVLNYSMITTDGRGHVSRNYNRSTYSAGVDGRNLGNRFRTEEGAMRAVARALTA